MSDMDTGQAVADVAPPPVIDSVVDDAPENLFADNTAELTDQTADTDKQDLEAVDDLNKIVDKPEDVEVQERRALFEKYKAEFEPDSVNFKLVSQKAKDFETKYESLKAFEPIAALPEVAKAVESLSKGIVQGKEAWAAVEAVALPGTIENLKEQALDHFLTNPVNHDIIAKRLLGSHVSATTMLKVGAALDPVNGTGVSEEDLLDFLRETPNSTLNSEELEERKQLQAGLAELAKQKADGERLAQENADKEENRNQRLAAEEIFTHTDKPLDEVEVLFGFVPNEKDPPEIRALKEEAREIYRSRAERLLMKDEQAQSGVKNIQAMLKQGSRQKERAMSMYAPSLSDRTKAIALQAGRSTNQFIKARLAEIKAGHGKAQLAPNEVGSLAATGGHVVQDDDDTTEGRQRRARLVMNAHMAAAGSR